MAKTLFGRFRTSTVLLAVVFVLTLSAYLLVRPIPASIQQQNQPPAPTSTLPPARRPTPRTPAPSRVPSPIPSPSHLRSPSPSASVPAPSTSAVPTDSLSASGTG